jgi:phosphoribosylglycinamide formyltransferase-1
VQKIKLAIFISGKGTNASKLMAFFKNHTLIEVGLVVSNNSNSPLLSVCETYEVPSIVCNNAEVANANYLLDVCTSHKIDFIVLAGFLRKIPESFVRAFSEKIFNIHPSLLPKFGGAGMYGDHVHSAVLEAGESKSGITIHLVNEEYDRGKILAQFECLIDHDEDMDALKEKISKLEHENYGKVIANYILKNHE